MATVKVDMKMCDKIAWVTVKQRDNGDLDVIIESDCEDVATYGKNLTKMTFNDAIDYENSAINSMSMRKNLSPHCLVPSAVFDAAWLELGMISKSLVRKVKTSVVEFTDENGELLNR
jgi:hypothetical protein